MTSWLCPSDGRIGDAVLIGQLTVLAGTEWTWTLNAQGKTSSLSENTWQEHGICISNTKDDRCAPPSKPRSIIMKPALSPSGRPASSALSPSLPRSIALLLYIRALVTPSALRLELRPAGGGASPLGHHHRVSACRWIQTSCVSDGTTASLRRTCGKHKTETRRSFLQKDEL